MPKTDFAILHWPAHSQALSIAAEGNLVTDDLLLRAIDEFKPPLLPRLEMAALRKEMDPSAERRGRRFWSREQLANALRKVRRPDVPQGFLDCLIFRLESGKRYTRVDASRKSQKDFSRIQNAMFAAGIYEDFFELIDPKATCVTHPILGTFNIEKSKASQRDKALTITAQVLRRMGRGGHVTNRRLANIISEYSSVKTHKIS